MSRQNFKLIFVESKDLTAQVKHLTFKREDALPFEFTAGQFITLHLEGSDKILRRSYSLANLVSGTEKIEFAASYVAGGVASEKLFNLKAGDEIEASGPFGRLILREEYVKRYIFVATGTGVTPYRSMLPELEKRHSLMPLQKAVLLFGVREPADLLYRDEFVAFAEKNSWFTFHAYYSRVKLDYPAFYENYGYVIDAFGKLQPIPTQDIFYLCGNPNMVDAAFTFLLARNFPSENIRREKYISSN